MMELMREHPWMTFWLLVIGLLVLDNALVSLAKALRRRP